MLDAFRGLLRTKTPARSTSTRDLKAEPESEWPASVACPYCNADLSPAPKRKKKCPACGGLVFVRTRPSDRRKVWVTEAQAQELEDLRAEYHSVQERFKGIGVDEAEQAHIVRELTKRFGRAPSPGDVFRDAANKKILEAGRRGDDATLSNIYWHQARFLFEEGRDYFSVMAESHRHILLANQGGLGGLIQYATILTDGCPACKRLEKRKYRIEHALREMPLPVKGCTWGLDQGPDGNKQGWCCCMYLFSRT